MNLDDWLPKTIFLERAEYLKESNILGFINITAHSLILFNLQKFIHLLEPFKFSDLFIDIHQIFTYHLGLIDKIFAFGGFVFIVSVIYFGIFFFSYLISIFKTKSYLHKKFYAYNKYYFIIMLGFLFLIMTLYLSSIYYTEMLMYLLALFPFFVLIIMYKYAMIICEHNKLLSFAVSIPFLFLFIYTTRILLF
jgi:hypothetical protein